MASESDIDTAFIAEAPVVLALPALPLPSAFVELSAYPSAAGPVVAVEELDSPARFDGANDGMAWRRKREFKADEELEGSVVIPVAV